MLRTCPTGHAPSGWSKPEQLLNISMFRPASTRQREMSVLNCLHHLNSPLFLLNEAGFIEAGFQSNRRKHNCCLSLPTGSCCSSRSLRARILLCSRPLITAYYYNVMYNATFRETHSDSHCLTAQTRRRRSPGRRSGARGRRPGRPRSRRRRRPSSGARRPSRRARPGGIPSPGRPPRSRGT
eukprot:SAG22_NODE_6181_length_889_cov_1.615190_3_plen_182_part_01